MLGAIQAPLALQGPQGGVDRAALASTVAEGHHRRLLAGVSGAQLGAVTNPVEVAHHTPAPAQPFPEAMQGIHDFMPAERAALFEGLRQGGL